MDREEKNVGGDLIATNDLRKDGRRKSPQQDKKFAATVAALTGEHKSTINKKLALGRVVRDSVASDAV